MCHRLAPKKKSFDERSELLIINEDGRLLGTCLHPEHDAPSQQRARCGPEWCKPPFSSQQEDATDNSIRLWSSGQN